MNESSSNKRGIIVGLFIFLGIVFLVAGILTIGNLRNTFSTKLHVMATFEDVNGLQKGNNIWFSGVKIGTVKTVTFFGKSHVKVVLSIDESAREFIRKDAKVKVSSEGFIGNKIVVIYGGTFRSDAVSEGDTLGVEKIVSTEDMISTLQENNRNILEITTDFKSITKKLAHGDGSLGKLLDDDNSVYNNINATTASLKNASGRAEQMMGSLNAFTSGLNKKGTLANSMVTDTLVFSSLKSTILKLNKISDSATVMINELKRASANQKTPVGVLLHDEQAGASLKATLANFEKSSQKLDEDLEAAQHSFLLKRYFKKKAKKDKAAK
jgi:phospholipid/cholesterol/gamma-HCH transport system substrate-binding protein